MPAEEHVEPCPRAARARCAPSKRRPHRRPSPRQRLSTAKPSRGDRQAGRAEDRRTRGCSKAAAARPRRQPSSAQISAIRSACRSDYPKVCAGVPTGGAPALQCLEKNKAKLSAGLREGRRRGERRRAQRRGRQRSPAAAAAGAAGAAAAPAAPAVIVLRPMRPREELFVLRSACGGDVRTMCGGVAPGGGRIVQCLATNAASLSPACQDVLSQFTAQ